MTFATHLTRKAPNMSMLLVADPYCCLSTSNCVGPSDPGFAKQIGSVVSSLGWVGRIGCPCPICPEVHVPSSPSSESSSVEAYTPGTSCLYFMILMQSVCRRDDHLHTHTYTQVRSGQIRFDL